MTARDKEKPVPRREPLVLLAIAAAVLAWSGIRPHDRYTWCSRSPLVPAMLARELLRRRTPLPSGGWLFFLATCVALAFSAFYELIEWWTAAASGTAAEAFLGTQGDVWDTQWDMFLALLGAVAAQLLLTRIHEKQLARVSR